MISAMSQFFTSIWSVFTNTTVPGTSIAFSTVYLAGIAVAVLSFALGKLFRSTGISGSGYRTGKNKRQKAGSAE